MQGVRSSSLLGSIFKATALQGISGTPSGDSGIFSVLREIGAS